MINKKQFIGYMNELKELNNIEDNINNSLKALDSDFNYLCFNKYTTLIICILRDVFEDKNDNISYWIYDLSFGKKWKRGIITYKNGRDIPMKTAEDLYNWLMKVMKNKKRIKQRKPISGSYDQNNDDKIRDYNIATHVQDIIKLWNRRVDKKHAKST